MTANGHRGWHTLHGEGRRLVSDDEEIVVKCQVRVWRDDYDDRFIELQDKKQGVYMCLALSREMHMIGQTFGRTQNEARSAMEALFARKGLGSTGLTFKGSAASLAFDKPAAVAFIAMVPQGWYTSYADVADAAGMGQAQAGALRVGQWIADEIEPGSVPRAYAVLKSDGRVNPKYKSAAPGMPATPKEAQARLESEGLTFGGDGRADSLRHWTVEHMRELRR